MWELLHRIRQRLALWFGSKPPANSLGARGEQAAEKYLKKLGYRIVDRNVRLGRCELDLVAVDGRTVVFVEVKTRQNLAAGHPAEAVDAWKQRHLTRAALQYLNRHRLTNHRARFDVLAILWPDATKPPEIQHIQHAFEALGD